MTSLLFFVPNQEDVSGHEGKNRRPGPAPAVLHRDGHRASGQQEIQVPSSSYAHTLTHKPTHTHPHTRLRAAEHHPKQQQALSAKPVIKSGRCYLRCLTFQFINPEFSRVEQLLHRTESGGEGERGFYFSEAWRHKINVDSHDGPNVVTPAFWL